MRSFPSSTLFIIVASLEAVVSSRLAFASSESVARQKARMAH